MEWLILNIYLEPIFILMGAQSGMKVSCECKNLTAKYNQSLSNTTTLNKEIEKLRDLREEPNWRLNMCSKLTFIFLGLALIFAVPIAMRKKIEEKKLLEDFKNENKELKELIKKLEDLLKENKEENEECDAYSMQIYV